MGQPMANELVDGPPAGALSVAGRYLLCDGHHRATAAWARGDQSLDVRVQSLPAELITTTSAAIAPISWLY